MITSWHCALVPLGQRLLYVPQLPFGYPGSTSLNQSWCAPHCSSNSSLFNKICLKETCFVNSEEGLMYFYLFCLTQHSIMIKEDLEIICISVVFQMSFTPFSQSALLLWCENCCYTMLFPEKSRKPMWFIYHLRTHLLNYSQ